MRSAASARNSSNTGASCKAKSFIGSVLPYKQVCAGYSPAQTNKKPNDFHPEHEFNSCSGLCHITARRPFAPPRRCLEGKISVSGRKGVRVLSTKSSQNTASAGA